MNHPTENEWLFYIEAEASPEDMTRLRAHLEKCPLCAAQVAGWRRTVQKLQRISFPAPRQGQPVQKLLISWIVKWSLAAAIVLLFGFALGRLSASRADLLAQTVGAQVRQELNGEIDAELLAALDPEREVKTEFQKQLRLKVEVLLAKTNGRFYTHAMEVIQRQRQEDQGHFLAFIQDVRNQQVSDTLALRHDLETAVATADGDLRQNSHRINQLARTLLTTQP
jgi:hypothetical protein